jgi:hypothetical protein
LLFSREIEISASRYRLDVRQACFTKVQYICVVISKVRSDNVAVIRIGSTIAMKSPIRVRCGFPNREVINREAISTSFRPRQLEVFAGVCYVACQIKSGEARSYLITRLLQFLRVTFREMVGEMPKGDDSGPCLVQTSGVTGESLDMRPAD